VDQVVVRAWIMLSDFFGGMGNVQLDRPAAARPEVYEERPSPGTEQVARMRLAVQELLASAPAADRSAQSAQRVAEELPVETEQRWSPLSVASLSLRTGDSIGEVRRPRSVWRRAACSRISAPAYSAGAISDPAGS
jgi:hypothetical protein